jgi:hypothetical protein
VGKMLREKFGTKKEAVTGRQKNYIMRSFIIFINRLIK